MKSSHSHCRKVQKALLHSKRCYCTAKLYCTAEGFAAQQKVLLHNRKFYYVVRNFTAHQKVLLHSRKVGPMAETREKFLLRQKQRISSLCNIFPWILDSLFAHKLAMVEQYFGAHFVKHQAQLPSQKKPRLSVVQ